MAKTQRMTLRALIIQTKFQYSDRELVQQIIENPYLQYFIGSSCYQETAPFGASTLVDFRKQITNKMLMETNDTCRNTKMTATKAAVSCCHQRQSHHKTAAKMKEKTRAL